MKRCLREYPLVMLYLGEGTQEERTHLASCEGCSRRYQHLAQDWQRIEHSLRAGPPQRMWVRPSLPLTQRWLPVAAALAATVLLVLASARGWQPASPVIAKTTPQEEVVSFVETTVVPALFADETLPDIVPPAPISDETYVQAAIDGEWPCEQDVSTSELSCDPHTFPLLIGG